MYDVPQVQAHQEVQASQGHPCLPALQQVRARRQLLLDLGGPGVTEVTFRRSVVSEVMLYTSVHAVTASVSRSVVWRYLKL